MKYVPLPIPLIELHHAIPVDVVNASGHLLLRRGQAIVSEEHRGKLREFNACITASDGIAWQRAYERTVFEHIRKGADVQEISKLPMPSEILESDYGEDQFLLGGWSDVQEVLRGIFYHPKDALLPLHRLAGLEKKVRSLLEADPDSSLFWLFQALTDESLGYSATHALLCAVICELTAIKLAITPRERRALLSSAMTMNIGMAREQDAMARQASVINDRQRHLIAAHSASSADILMAFGIENPDHLDIVRWHHQPQSPAGLPHNRIAREILHLADIFVARTAARKTRASLSPLKAVKTMVMGAQGDQVSLGSAMAQAVSFYPPGSYVMLESGETAVSVQRGLRANTPWVIALLDKNAMPLGRYVCLDTSERAHAIARPLNFEKVRVLVNPDKVQRAREKIPH
jgi:HD-GYP domain-containing protein (c-di-GMP phosphodiesterase class II)